MESAEIFALNPANSYISYMYCYGSTEWRFLPGKSGAPFHIDVHFVHAGISISRFEALGLDSCILCVADAVRGAVPFKVWWDFRSSPEVLRGTGRPFHSTRESASPGGSGKVRIFSQEANSRSWRYVFGWRVAEGRKDRFTESWFRRVKRRGTVVSSNASVSITHCPRLPKLKSTTNDSNTGFSRGRNPRIRCVA